MEPVTAREYIDDHWATSQAGIKPTPRQLEVLLAVILEHGGREAADKLGISEQTVKNHLTNLYARGPYYNQADAIWHLYPVLRQMADSCRST